MDRKDTMSDPRYGFAGELNEAWKEAMPYKEDLFILTDADETLDLIPPTRMSEILPPVTCGQELADGTRCDRPSLHAGDCGDTNGTGCFCPSPGFADCMH